MEVEIITCPYPEKCKMEGTIVDETRNMLVVEQNHKDVKLPKQGTRLAFKLPADDKQPDKLVKIEVDGELFIARPEDRVKKNEGRLRRK
jgi:RNase P/RNase MRP subunit p29